MEGFLIQLATPAAFARAARGDQRAGTLSGLDNHDGEREARNQAVAAREVARRRTLRNKGPARPYRPDSKTHLRSADSSGSGDCGRLVY
jgi:hypothetical protein